MFDHSSLRCKVSTENSDASVGSDRLVIWTDDIFLCKVYIVTFVKFLKPFVAFLIKSVVLQLLKVFSESLSCNCHHIQMEMFFDFLHDRRYTTCIIEALSRPASCRTYIQKISGISVQSVKGISGNLNTKFMCNCRKMKQAVGAS